MPRAAWVPHGQEIVDLLVQFVLGGTVVGGVSALSALCSDKVAALVYALPITYVPILLYVWRHARRKACPLALRSFLGQNVAGTALLLLFCLSLYFIVSAHTPPPPAEGEPLVCVTGMPSAAGVWAMIGASLLFVAVPMRMYWDWVCSTGGAACALHAPGKPCVLA